MNATPPNSAELAALYNGAVQHYQSGDIQSAEMACRKILTIAPRHPATCQLLGAIAFQFGDHDQAIALLGIALEANTTDSAAHANFGLALHAAGRFEEAVDTLQHASKLRPGSAPVLCNLGNALDSAGRPEDAVNAYRDAISAEPDYAAAHLNLGTTLRSLKRFAEAVDACRRATEIDPEMPEGFYNLGNALSRVSDFDGAVTAYREALRLRPAFAQAADNLGAMLLTLHDYQAAANAFRHAIAHDETFASPHYQLGNALRELGEFDDALESYHAAIALEPTMERAHTNLGVTYQLRDRHEDALAAYEAAISAAPTSAGTYNNQGSALQALGRLDEAAKSYSRAIELDPLNSDSVQNLADLELERGNGRAALDVCTALLDIAPTDRAVLAFKAIVLDELGWHDEAQHFRGMDRLVRPLNIQAPPGFATLQAFNQALSSHILDHPSLTWAPTGNATRMGRHSGSLLVEPKGPFAAFENVIRGAVEAYCDTFKSDPSHPFLSVPPPTDWSLTVWSVVMEEEGHQIPHIHPTGWLSGVYYPKVPATIDANSDGRTGWIEFGRPPETFHATKLPELRYFCPEEGLLILFPSYLYHRTIPFTGHDARISIAFDVIPKTD